MRNLSPQFDVPYHGHNNAVLRIGDLVRYTMVTGFSHLGVLLKVEPSTWPHNITYSTMLTEHGVVRLNTNLVWRLEQVSCD
jgi:hypothetical protein